MMKENFIIVFFRVDEAKSLQCILPFYGTPSLDQLSKQKKKIINKNKISLEKII